MIASGCGYGSVYAPAKQAPVSLQVGQALIPDAIAVQAAMSGARSELAAAGRAQAGSSFPRLVIDVLRVDELSRSVHVESGQPRAGGMSIAITVRGRLFRAERQEPSFDSGDLRRSAQLSGDADPRVDGAAYDQALRAAAERAGRAVARTLLGIPEPADEAP